MGNKYILILLFSLCLYMCDTSNSKNESTELFEMETDHFLKVQSIKYGDTKYFKSIKIVKLETLDENLIGGIIQLELYDNKFYILDKYLSVSNLFVFDLEGNYLYKIGTRGQGPEEYINISSFFIDEKEGIVNIVDGLTSTVIRYDKEGTFINKIKHNNPHLDFMEKAKVIDDNLFCYSGTNWEGNNMFFVVDKNNFSIKKKIRKYPGEYLEHFMINFCMHPFTYIDGEFHFGALFTDTIFSFKNDTIVPYMIARGRKNINLHKLQQELEKDKYDYGKTIGRIAKENKYTTGTSNYFENKRYILRDFIIADNLLGAVLWDKRDNEGVYLSKYIQNCGPELSSFIATSGNTVIRIWNNKTIQMFKNEMDENRIKMSDYPPEVIDQIKNYNTEEDNPLLILYEFKDD